MSDGFDYESALDEYRRQAVMDWNAQLDQRDRADEDNRFISVPGAQWENFLTQVYGLGNRPRFQYDRLASAVNRFMAEWDLNRKEVRFVPADGDGEDEAAEVLDGLFRRDCRRNNGRFAIDNAVRGAATCGYGAFRLITEWADETETRKIIRLDPIYNAPTTLCWDINSRRMDKADARRCTLIHEYSHDAFKEKWPEAQPTSVYQQDRRWGDFTWATKQSVFVGERYHVEEKKVTSLTFINPTTLQEETFWEDEINLVRDDMRQMGFQLVREQKIFRRRVMKCVFSGAEILEKPKEVDGRFIPIVPVYGFWSYVDGQERYAGIVTFKKDPQRLFNMEISRMAEMSASAPRDTPIFDITQMDDPSGIIRKMWEESQFNPMPYLLVKALRNGDGSVVQTGPLGYLQSPKVDPNSAAILELTASFLQQETGGAPQDVLDPESSGKAINAQAMRVDMDTQPIMTNISMALERCGEIYRWMAADAYSDPRTITVVDKDGGEHDVQLFTTAIDKKTGRPKIINDITRGKFEVVVSTGPSHGSVKEATVANLKDLLSVMPPDSPYYAPMMAMLIDNLTGVGLDGLKQFNRKLMIAKGLAEPKTPEEEQIAQAANQPQQPDPTQVLMLATAAREQSTAELNKVKAIETAASATLKHAQAQSEAASVPLDHAKAVSDIALARERMTRSRPLLRISGG